MQNVHTQRRVAYATKCMFASLVQNRDYALSTQSVAVIDVNDSR